MEYHYKEISELGKVITGKTPPTENNAFFGGEFPFITPSDIHSYDEKYILETERTISSEGAKKLKGMLLPKGSICFVCIGSTIGKMCMTHKDSYTNQQINSLLPSDKYDNDYLFYYLRFIKGFFQSIGAGTGSGKGIINKTLFSKTKIRVLEDKVYQQTIAKILSAYDNLIENNNKRIKILEQMAENLYKEWFVRFRFPGHETTPIENGIPHGWDYKPLFKVASVSYGYTFKSELFCEDSSLKPVVRIRDILDNKTNTYTSEECDEKYLISKHSILVGMDGIFHMCLWNGSTAYLNQRVVKIDSIEKDICNYLLYFAIRPQVKFWEQTISGTTVAHLGDKHLKKMSVLVPPKELLQVINRQMKAFMEEKNSLFIANQNLIKQRDLLLPRLMSGKITV